MRITHIGVTAISGMTVDADLDMGGIYQVKNLAAPASGEALRKGNKDIANAEVADAAAIARSKLDFGAGLVNADIAAAAAIAGSKIDGDFVESGDIVIWTDTIANIPAGWVICDGNNSTPNLLTKFIQGVATAATDPGATGGAATHALSIAELAAHTHTVPKKDYSGSGNYLQESNATTSTVTSSSTGSGSAHENEPTFYDVAFLMKT